MKHTRYEALLAFCKAVEWASNPKIAYQRFVDACIEYLECDGAHLHLLDASGKSFVHSASCDQKTDPAAYSQSLSLRVGRIRRMIDNRDLIIMEDYEHPDNEDEIPDSALEMGYRSAVSIPLCASSGVLGMLSIVYKTALPWKSDDDKAFLLQIGSVLGIFAQRIQMQKKDLELNLLRERKQLSSEIHDSVSQMASALALHADTAQECFEDGDLPSLSKELHTLSDQLRQMTKVLRDEMLSLRTSFEVSDGTVKVLENALDRFQNFWDMHACLHVQTDSDIPLPGYARLQLARIVNESFLNIVRHSKANSVEVAVARRNGNVLIDIIDDGIGFDVESVPSDRLGLRIMKERTESVGGTLEVDSDTSGTAIRICLPVAHY